MAQKGLCAWVPSHADLSLPKCASRCLPAGAGALLCRGWNHVHARVCSLVDPIDECAAPPTASYSEGGLLRGVRGVESHARAFARAGLVGNPSGVRAPRACVSTLEGWMMMGNGTLMIGVCTDGFGGKTLSVALQNFWADAWIEPAACVVLVPHPLYDMPVCVRVRARGGCAPACVGDGMHCRGGERAAVCMKCCDRSS